MNLNHIKRYLNRRGWQLCCYWAPTPCGCYKIHPFSIYKDTICRRFNSLEDLQQRFISVIGQY